jgi:hypothetical protein
MLFFLVISVGIFWYANDLATNSSAIEKAPVLQGTGTIRAITFIPQHTEERRYKSGKYSYRTETYTVNSAYSIILMIDGLNKEVSFIEYNLAKGEKYKQGDEVMVGYKQIDFFFLAREQIHIVDVR